MKKRNWLWGIVAALALLSAVFFVKREISFRVATIFQDHAILQRDKPLPVWGWGKPGQSINVTIKPENGGNAQKESAVVNHEGKWQVVFPPNQAGGPYLLTTSNWTGNLSLHDIYFGDVWFCSGQSNMVMRVEETLDADKEMVSANYPLIHHFKVKALSGLDLQEDIKGEKWEACSPGTVGKFTAVGYYFAKKIHQEKGVPVGIINASWGSSRIEPWMSAEALGYAGPPSAKKAIEKQVATERQEQINLFGQLTEKDLGESTVGYPWAGMPVDSTWKELILPGWWDYQGYPDLNGIIWLKKEIAWPAHLANKDAMLSLGVTFDDDMTWVNGVLVGSTENEPGKRRKYAVPAGLLKAGANHITVRITDKSATGGLDGYASELFLSNGNFTLPLEGEWRFKAGALFPQDRHKDFQTPTALYSHMVYPLHRFPIKGFLWYQGESNTHEDDAFIYREYFPKLINDWRTKWKNDGLPFLYVQVANIGPFPFGRDDHHRWPLLRESQSLAAATMPNVAQVVSFDVSHPENIHPPNKKPIGERLALAARNLAYGEKDSVYQGPIFQRYQIDGKEIRLEFDTNGRMLIAQPTGTDLKGFEIAGVDKIFAPAKAKIEGTQVVVWNEKITAPKWVRYAWSRNPTTANLYSEHGLPATPFRTYTDN